MAGSSEYRDVPFDGEFNADALDLGRINRALQSCSQNLPEVLRFDGIYTIEKLQFKGIPSSLSLKGAVTGTEASFRFE